MNLEQRGRLFQIECRHGFSRQLQSDNQREDFPPVLLDGGKRHVPGRPAASLSGRPGRELSSHPVGREGRQNPASWGER